MKKEFWQLITLALIIMLSVLLFKVRKDEKILNDFYEYVSDWVDNIKNKIDHSNISNTEITDTLTISNYWDKLEYLWIFTSDSTDPINWVKGENSKDQLIDIFESSGDDKYISTRYKPDTLGYYSIINSYELNTPDTLYYQMHPLNNK
jgi:hypothetical protein